MESWNRALNWIRDKLSEQVFETWFSPIELKTLDDDCAVLEVPNNFFKEWLSNNYIDFIQEALFIECGKNYKVVFEISKERDSIAPPSSQAPKPINSRNASTRKKIFIESKLNPKYTFQNFVVGTSNQLPHAASLAVAQKPNSKFNPLFIYGGVGLGKTHLLHAIGNMVKTQYPQRTVCYLSSEQFMNEFIHSLRNNKMESFRNKYRNHF